MNERLTFWSTSLNPFASRGPQVLVQAAPKVYEEGPGLERLREIVQTFAEEYNTAFQANKVTHPAVRGFGQTHTEIFIFRRD